MRRLLTVFVLAGLLAACSSSSDGAAPPSSTTTTTAPVHAPAPSPRKAAIALTHRLLAEVVLPGAARRTTTPLPKMLRGPWQVPAGQNLVSAGQGFTLPLSRDAVLAFLHAHTPRGLVDAGTGYVSSPTERVDYVTDRLVRMPANVAEAGVEIGVEPHGAGSLVDVVAGAQWTPVRPANELAGARDHVVVIRVLPYGRPAAPAVRRVVATGAAAAAIATAFDALLVAPAGVIRGCPAIGPRDVTYEIAFAATARARPDVTADRGPCGPITVDVDGKRGLSLNGSSAFDHALADALGASTLTFLK